MISRIGVLALSLILLSGCQKDYLVSEDQKVLFQLSYVNYAWGFSNRGYLIDKDGNILSYSNPIGWNFPDNEKILTADQVNENLAKCVPTGKKISPSDLQKHVNYIDDLASGKLSPPVSRGADMGEHGYYCFQYFPRTSTYKCITIKIEGDWVTDNMDASSKKVSAWLRDVTLGL